VWREFGAHLIVFVLALVTRVANDDTGTGPRVVVVAAAAAAAVMVVQWE
jgi:hypothetical protein